MNKLFKITVGVVIGLTLSAQALAGKIVVFSPQDAILQTQVAKQAASELEKSQDFLSLVQQAEALKADLDVLKTDYETNAMVWTAEQKEEKTKQAATIRQNWQGTMQNIQGMQQQLVGALAKQMEGNLRQAIETVVTAEDADIVMQKQATLFSKPEVDITLKVVEILDKLNAKPADISAPPAQ